MEVKREKIVFVLFCLFICGLTLPSYADGPDIQWQKTFGGSAFDQGHSVLQTSDGGFVIDGSTTSFGKPGYDDVYLIKTDSAGNLLWQKTFGGSGYDYGYSVQQTVDCGYIIAGTSTPSYDIWKRDVYLIKTDSDGNSIWQKKFGGSNYDEGYSVQQTTDGGFIVAGYTHSFGAGSDDVYLIKTDSDGNSIWQKTFGGIKSDIGQSVQQTTDGGFIIAGYTWSFGIEPLDCNVYLIKTDSLGNSLWQKTFGGSGSEYGHSVQQTTDGGFIVAGQSINSFGSVNWDVYLIKTDSDGNLMWQKTFGESSSDQGLSVHQTSDAGHIITGVTDSFGEPNGDVYLIKTDSNGNLLWQNTIGGSSYEDGRSVQQTSDEGFIIAGMTKSFGAGGYDVYLIKLAATADIPGNLDYDGDVDCNDLERFVSEWLNIDCSDDNIWCSGADLDKSGFVDFIDLAILCDHWLEGINP